MNEAISQLDQGTQHNASLAKQSSSASFELKKETEVLENIVTQLESLVKKVKDDKQDYSKNVTDEDRGKILSFNEKRVSGAGNLEDDDHKTLLKKVSNGATNWDEL